MMYRTSILIRLKTDALIYPGTRNLLYTAGIICKFASKQMFGAWRSPVSALDWGARGRWLKSSRPDIIFSTRVAMIVLQTF